MKIVASKKTAPAFEPGDEVRSKVTGEVHRVVGDTCGYLTILGREFGGNQEGAVWVLDNIGGLNWNYVRDYEPAAPTPKLAPGMPCVSDGGLLVIIQEEDGEIRRSHRGNVVVTVLSSGATGCYSDASLTPLPRAVFIDDYTEDEG